MCVQWYTTVSHLHHLMYLCIHIFNHNVNLTACVYNISLNFRFHLHITKHKNYCLSVIFLTPSVHTHQ